MANKRIRKKWLSRLRKEARKIAKRFKIPRQEVGFALSGTIVDSTIRPDGVREITDFRVYSVSLVPREQALHPSWRVQEVRDVPLTVVRDYPDQAVAYDVRLFGAVGDGVTDDTGAIQAAINFAHKGRLLK